MTTAGAHQLRDCFYAASVRVSRAARHVVSFNTGADASPETANAFVDAAAVASNSLVEMAGRPEGQSALTRITSVVITMGEDPSASLVGGVLTVTIAPARGVAGRPSSRQIERVAEAPVAPAS